MALPPHQLTPTTWLLIAMTLLTKLLPYATLPPPATAPELRIFWPARNVTLPVATPNASAAPAPDGAHAAAPRCCVETGQCATASLLLRRLAPWLPLNASSTRAAAAATKPLLRGVRPVAATGLGERLGIPSPDALAAGHKERLKTEVMNKFKDLIGKDEKKDDSAKDQMALWKQWMTIEDKASFGKDEWHCRKTPLPWMKQWHCLWDTAYWGPHGFLFGTNEESKSDATDLKTCARRPAADRPRAGRRPARAPARPRARAPARPRARAPARPRARAPVAASPTAASPTAAPPRSQVPLLLPVVLRAPRAHRDVHGQGLPLVGGQDPTRRPGGAADAGEEPLPPPILRHHVRLAPRADQHLPHRRHGAVDHVQAGVGEGARR